MVVILKVLTQLSILHLVFTASQYRAVTARDYEAIIQSIYPNTESVAVVGGEELDPPEFGQVLISIKPKNGDFVSDFDKQNIYLN